MSMKKASILIADDDPQLLRLMLRNLEMEGYEVLGVSDGQQALARIEQQPPDLVLLDVMMPKLDGLTVCSRVREFSAVPIILVTARGQDQEKVRGLDLGADDYLPKPFSVEELVARVRAVLRRSHFAAQQSSQGLAATVTTGDLTVDFSQHSVILSGRELPVTPTEYRLLAYLAQNAGRILTQQMLLEQIWGAEYLGESHLLHVNIGRLRSKIEADPTSPRYLLTRAGVGYTLALVPAASDPGAEKPAGE